MKNQKAKTDRFSKPEAWKSPPGATCTSGLRANPRRLSTETQPSWRGHRLHGALHGAQRRADPLLPYYFLRTTSSAPSLCPCVASPAPPPPSPAPPPPAARLHRRVGRRLPRRHVRRLRLRRLVGFGLCLLAERFSCQHRRFVEFIRRRRGCLGLSLCAYSRAAWAFPSVTALLGPSPSSP